MNTGVLLLSHGGIAAALCQEASRILPGRGEVAILGVTPDEACDTVRDRLRAAIQRLDQGDGVLILADVEGATPCNQVTQLLNLPEYRPRVRLVTGLNLPMLLKVLTYRRDSLARLAELAVMGGTGSRSTDWRYGGTGKWLGRG